MEKNRKGSTGIYHSIAGNAILIFTHCKQKTEIELGNLYRYYF